MSLGFVLRALAVLFFGAFLGLGATWAAVWKGHGFGAVVAGPWIAWPRAGSQAVDPYSRAALSRTGELPLDLTEGLVFFARTDSAGAELAPQCRYLISGAVPPARYWTLTVATQEGALAPNPAKRYGFTSAEILRDERGAFSIVVSPEASAGNWLPYSASQLPLLILRVYDTPVSAAASALGAADLPSIVRENCR